MKQVAGQWGQKGPGMLDNAPGAKPLAEPARARAAYGSVSSTPVWRRYCCSKSGRFWGTLRPVE